MSDDLERTLGRIETRVADLADKTNTIQQEVNGIKKALENDLVSHRERIGSLESFRRWTVGILTGALLSTFGAWLSHLRGP